MALSNAEKQAAWRERRNALAREAEALRQENADLKEENERLRNRSPKPKPWNPERAAKEIAQAEHELALAKFKAEKAKAEAITDIAGIPAEERIRYIDDLERKVVELEWENDDLRDEIASLKKAANPAGQVRPNELSANVPVNVPVPEPAPTPTTCRCCGVAAKDGPADVIFIQGLGCICSECLRAFADAPRVGDNDSGYFMCELCGETENLKHAQFKDPTSRCLCDNCFDRSTNLIEERRQAKNPDP